MHVSRNFYDARTNSTHVNYKMFLESLGKHEDRLKNLFFVYAAVVRAVNRADPLLKKYDYQTGLDKLED